MHVEKADRLCNACKDHRRKARPLDVAAYWAKGVRTARPDALTPPVAAESAEHQVVEGHSRVNCKSWIKPFCGDMQKPPRKRPAHATPVSPAFYRERRRGPLSGRRSGSGDG